MLYRLDGVLYRRSGVLYYLKKAMSRGSAIPIEVFEVPEQAGLGGWFARRVN